MAVLSRTSSMSACGTTSPDRMRRDAIACVGSASFDAVVHATVVAFMLPMLPAGSSSGRVGSTAPPRSAPLPLAPATPLLPLTPAASTPAESPPVPAVPAAAAASAVLEVSLMCCACCDTPPRWGPKLMLPAESTCTTRSAQTEAHQTSITVLWWTASSQTITEEAEVCCAWVLAGPDVSFEFNNKLWELLTGRHARLYTASRCAEGGLVISTASPQHACDSISYTWHAFPRTPGGSWTSYSILAAS